MKLDTHEYALLAEFRYALRSFIHFSESAAKGVGLNAQQYQALLALRGFPKERDVTINDLARQLLIRHNTAVGLVDRLGKEGFVTRRQSRVDGRRIHLQLTAKGDRMLERLASVHREELRRIGPQLRLLLQQITRAIEKPRRSG